MSRTIRVSKEAHETLKLLAKEERRSIGAVIADAVEGYRKQKFWASVNESVERLRADPAAWQDYQDEIAFVEGRSTGGSAKG
jgi:predicted transcriptional regulator